MADCKTMLIVDDSRIARMIIRGIVEDAHKAWEIVEAEHGAQALEKTEEIRSELPIYHQGTGEQILESTGESASDDIIMFIRVDFTLRDTDIKGYVVFTLNIDSMEALVKAADRFIGTL